MIKQSSAGIYSWLPLGFKVMKKIEQIVREEQNFLLFQSSELWKESGRYEDYGEEMLKLKIPRSRNVIWTNNEELITDIFHLV